MTKLQPYWWVLAAIAIYVVQALLSQKNRDTPTTFWFMALWFVGMVPLWGFVSRKSTNLIFDGMLYDVIIFLSYSLTFIVIGEGKAFTTIHWIGFASVLCGFIMLKWPS